MARSNAAGLTIAMVMLLASPCFAQDTESPQTEFADASAMPTSTSDLFDKDETTDDIAARYHQERMTIPVRIDGKGPFPFLVDTGSEATVVSEQLATNLGLIRHGEARLIGTISTKGVETVRLSALGVGRKTIEDLPAVLLDADHVGAAGILGIDTLRGHRVIFDFANDSISIGQPGRASADKEYEIIVRAKRKQDRMVISNARIDGVKVSLIIDTGSNYSIGNTVLRDRLQADATLGYAGIMDVTGTQSNSDVVMVDMMQIDSLRLAKSVLLIQDSPAFAELGLDDKPAVLLGMNHLRAFARMSVDFTRREVAFDLAE